MTWFKVDDTLAFHRKAMAAGNAAMGLWVRAGSLCSQQLTDGRVSADTARAIGSAAEIRRLVAVDLWHQPGHDCPDCPPIQSGYVFHEWEQANPTRDEVETERERRRAAGQAGGKASGRSRRKARAQADASANAQPNAEAKAKQTGSEVPNTRPVPSRPVLQAGQVGGGSSGTDRAQSAPAAAPPPQTIPDQQKQPQRPRCMAHRHLPDDDPGPSCVGCREARRRAEDDAMAAAAERQRAIRSCGLCDADGRRRETLGIPGDPPCDHHPLPAVETPRPAGRSEFDRIRAQANEQPCPTCRDPDNPHEPMPVGQTCRDPETGQLLRAPAHHTRIAATQARSVPA